MNREQLIEAFRGLRVADVSDAMDYVGLLGRGLMSRKIRPVFRDTDTFSHRISGPALTVRLVPTNREVPNLPPEEFATYEGEWYRDVAPERFGERIQAGDILVVDAAEQDVGFVGSNNCLGWMNRGVIGVVTNGGARDTDELIKQRCPVYSRYISRAYMPGRMESDAVGAPINCAGALVRSGDMIVADGDGVIVVPVEKAPEVARIARGILGADKKGRRQLYEALGLPPDVSVSD